MKNIFAAVLLAATAAAGRLPQGTTLMEMPDIEFDFDGEEWMNHVNDVYLPEYMPILEEWSQHAEAAVGGVIQSGEDSGFFEQVEDIFMDYMDDTFPLAEQKLPLDIGIANDFIDRVAAGFAVNGEYIIPAEDAKHGAEEGIVGVYCMLGYCFW